MDYKIAHEIMKFSLLHEFPWMYFFGTSFALIKTYAVASGTPLLVQTRQLTTDAKVGRRAEDTGVLIAEFVVGSVDSERGLKALSKVNWLHARYGSKIGNDEMTHTLAMFVLEPHTWVDRYEWRAISELEKVAAFVYWKEIGNRMGIRDIPGTLDDLRSWTETFEEKNMVYAKSNRICAETTMNLYLRNIPGYMKSFARHAANSLLEERVRIALGAADPPRWIQRLVVSTLTLRGLLVRYFFLPRFHSKDPLSRPGPDGRLQRDQWAFEPWYVKDTFVTRLATWFKSNGRLSPNLSYKSTGYLPEELGPAEFEMSSKEAVLKQAEAMKIYASMGGATGVGCPFSLSMK